jgi:hypothetical protein
MTPQGVPRFRAASGEAAEIGLERRSGGPPKTLDRGSACCAHHATRRREDDAPKSENGLRTVPLQHPDQQAVASLLQWKEGDAFDVEMVDYH